MNREKMPFLKSDLPILQSEMLELTKYFFVSSDGDNRATIELFDAIDIVCKIYGYSDYQQLKNYLLDEETDDYLKPVSINEKKIQKNNFKKVLESLSLKERPDSNIIKNCLNTVYRIRSDKVFLYHIPPKNYYEEDEYLIEDDFILVIPKEKAIYRIPRQYFGRGDEFLFSPFYMMCKDRTYLDSDLKETKDIDVKNQLFDGQQDIYSDEAYQLLDDGDPSYCGIYKELSYYNLIATYEKGIVSLGKEVMGKYNWDYQLAPFLYGFSGLCIIKNWYLTAWFSEFNEYPEEVFSFSEETFYYNIQEYISSYTYILSLLSEKLPKTTNNESASSLFDRHSRLILLLLYVYGHTSWLESSEFDDELFVSTSTTNWLEYDSNNSTLNLLDKENKITGLNCWSSLREIVSIIPASDHKQLSEFDIHYQGNIEMKGVSFYAKHYGKGYKKYFFSYDIKVMNFDWIIKTKVSELGNLDILKLFFDMYSIEVSKNGTIELNEKKLLRSRYNKNLIRFGTYCSPAIHLYSDFNFNKDNNLNSEMDEFERKKWTHIFEDMNRLKEILYFSESWYNLEAIVGVSYHASFKERFDVIEFIYKEKIDIAESLLTNEISDKLKKAIITTLNNDIINDVNDKIHEETNYLTDHENSFVSEVIWSFSDLCLFKNRNISNGLLMEIDDRIEETLSL